MYGDCIAYDWWLGKVYDLKNQIILKLSNGSRYVVASISGRALTFSLLNKAKHTCTLRLV